MVIIPLKLPGRKGVLGTMHIERGDRKQLERTQIDALEYFAQQVARAIDVTARTDLIEDATKEQADAIVLVDQHERICYVNDQGSVLTKLISGWQDESSPPLARKLLPKDILSVMRQARESAGSAEKPSDSALPPVGPVARPFVSGYVRDEGATESLHVVYARPLLDWRGCVIGTMLQIRDLSHLSKLQTSLKKFAACRTTDSLAHEIVQSLAFQGHQWGRLYLMEKATGRLIGRTQFGFPEGSEGAEAFRNSLASLPILEQSPTTWRCLSEGQPVVLSMCLNRPDDEDFKTANGLSVRNTRDKCYPDCLKKRDGEIWIDIPLCSRDGREWFGKLSVHCPDSFTLEEFERLRILAEAAGSTFAAIVQHEKQERDNETKLRDAMQRAIGETCHQLSSKLASFETLEELYRIAVTPDAVERLNFKWRERKKDVQAVLDEAKTKLRPIQCNLRHHNLADVLKRTFEDQMGEKYGINIGDGSVSDEFAADFDDRLIQEVVEELITNAKKARKNSLTFKVRISRSTNRDGEAVCRIDIQDNGPGIPAQLRERIFDDFYCDWRNSEVSGTGLGLSLVKSIIRAHRGTISCLEPENGSGARFLIEFPRFSGIDKDKSSVAGVVQPKERSVR